MTMEKAAMIATIRERLHAKNAAILAEINRPKHSAAYRQWILAEETGLYPETDIYAQLSSNISDEFYIGDDDDISIDALRMIARSMGIPVDD